MKLNFKYNSIVFKTITVIFIIVLIIQGLSTYFYIEKTRQSFHETAKRELKLLGAIMIQNLTAPILFNDTIEIKNLINSLKKNPLIIYASLLDPNYNTIYEFKKDEQINKITITLSIFDPSEERIIGILKIHRSLYDCQKGIKSILKTSIIFSIILLLFSLVIAYFLQNLITKPIINFTNIVSKISKSKDFSLRINEHYKDEIGELIKRFNELLDTIEKQNKEIKESQERALKLAQVKQQFLANMSHEIRTPMNAIIGMTNLLLNSNLTSEQRDLLTHINIAANNLLVILNDILEYSKIEARKIKFEHVRFNINDVLDNVYKLYEHKAKEKGLLFKINKDTNIPPFLFGDPVRLNQILVNIISNAIKFTEKGHVLVDIKIKEINTNKVTLMFSICDSGIGIPEEKKEEVFESFSQLNSTYSKYAYGGTGLGLAITKQLVELQNGKIFFESKVNQGTCFYVILTFDIAEAPSLGELIKDADLEISLIKDLQFRQPVILVAEDNDLNRKLITILLKKQYILNVIEAKNGHEVINILNEKNVDILIIDIQMPEMDGYETIKFIREKFSSPKSQIPAIALTAFAFPEEKEKCFKYGFNEYIVKPFKPKELFILIHKLLFRK
ncbi:MAG: ATP-binding protein [Bacteroidales bacterium]|nr:ATP-binding protein [Bacteroidales bacterium]